MAIRIIDVGQKLAKLKDLRPVLQSIGALALAASQRAFTEKRFGEFRWPTRYPTQEEPFINVAAALSDLNRGRPVKQRRLDREPVLRDTGALFKGLSFRVTGTKKVQVGVGSGPARSYAKQHQEGLKSRQRVSQTARDTLTRQRRRARGEMKEALKKLGFLYSVNSLETQIAKRPFVGITPQLESDIRDLIEDFMQEPAERLR